MYNKEIKPIISEMYYDAIKTFLGDNIDMSYQRITFSFIKEGRRYFRMKTISILLGVSVRHLYRILLVGSDHTKGNKITNMIHHLFNSKDYKTFIELCYESGISINDTYRQVREHEIL